MKYSEPENAPETLLAADGVTTLNRYRVEAVIYAVNRENAEQLLKGAKLYFDAAKIKDDSPAEGSVQSAHISEYVDWLKGYVKHGGKPTHTYNYPFSRSGFEYIANGTLVIDSDKEFGAKSRNVIAARGVRILRTNDRAGFNGWGHSRVYSMDKFRTNPGSLVPIYNDPEFDEFRDLMPGALVEPGRSE